jgi:hypothetical protein
MMKTCLQLLVLFLVVLILGCQNDDCSDIACFTPPTYFTFRLIGLSSGDDLFANGTLDSTAITVINTLDEATYAYQFNSYNEQCYLVINSVGWQTEEVNLEVRAGGDLLFTLYIDAERKTENCCGFTAYNEVAVDDAEFEYETGDYVYKILIPE